MSDSKKDGLKIGQWRVGLITGISITGLTICLSLTGLFQLLEWATLELFFGLRPPEEREPRIVVVGIDELDIQEMGQWPISDAQLAKLLNKIKKQQPLAIGLDIFRDLPVPPGYEQLVEVMKSTPNLIGIEKVLGNKVAPAPILKETEQVAIADVILDADGKLRRGLISVFSDDQQVKLTLGTKLALMYLETERIQLREIEPEVKYGLGKAIFRRFQGNDGGYVKADDSGYQILLNFRSAGCGKERKNCAFEIVSMREVLEDNIPSDLMKQRLVFIGPTSPSVGYFFYTPYSNSDATATTGIEIHAHLASQIISAAIEERKLIKTVPDPVEWFVIFIWSIFGANIGSICLKKRCAVIGFVVTVSSLLGGSYLAFLGGWWLPVATPLIAVTGSTIVSITYTLAWKLKISYEELENYARFLEEKVQARTKELEKAKKAADAANAAKSAFLANMSHELRTPLNAILGFTQVMYRDHFLNENQKEHLEIISRSGEHLLGLINDVLDISKIEAGKITFNKNTVDLYILLKSVAEMLKLNAELKGLNFILEIDPTLPQNVATDEQKLRQVLINLLSNAIKFTEVGRVRLKVKNIGDDFESESNIKQNKFKTIKFEVEDTGAGIKPEEIDKLFEAFVQTETGKKSSQGTGLGLTISQKFVQLMGGEITVKSLVGKGTTFTFEIKMEVIPGEKNQKLTQKTVIGLEKNQPQYRILIVDNKSENRKLLWQILAPIGFETKEASNGKEAIEIWENWQPHLIWMDLLMPVMDGYQATKEIRAREKEFTTLGGGLAINCYSQPANLPQQKPNYSTVKIIAITATTLLDEVEKQFFSLGGDDLVNKPFQSEKILAKMAKHLGIEYVYESETTNNQALILNQNENLLEPQITLMSAQWKKKLYLAAMECSDEKIFALLEEISAEDILAKTLKHWVDEFRYDKITDLIAEYQA